MNQLPAFRLHHFTAATLLILLITASTSCTKSSNSSSSSNTSDTSNNGKGGNGALLTQEVVVVTNSSGATVDSIVTSYQYNSNNLVTGMQQNSTYADSVGSLTTNLSYTVTWSGNLPSSLSGTFVETAQDGVLNESATIQINTTFQSSGGHIVSYIQRTSTTSGTVFFPPTQITGNDSALLTYDAGGNLSTYNIYNIPNGSSAYEPFSFTTYTFGGGNLTQTVENVYVVGIQTATYTTEYQYNSKLAAAPLFLYPGIAAIIINDLSQTTETETGLIPQTIVTAYNTTYNYANQPATTKGTVTTTPASSGITTENITYTYQ
ncbi:MAG TPA: hypothetical protein VNV35_09415 [Puia sp.]|nr:hypothetical protein [Puia sp.]